MSIAPALDKNLPVPLYYQLQEVLKAELESGKWKPGEKLPSEVELSRHFGVSMITLREALKGLAELGYIRREHGRGTFVERRKFDEGTRELTSFTEEMRGHDLLASSRILSQLVSEADGRTATALGLTIGDPVFVLKRLRLAAGEPVSVQTAHIPAEFVPGLVVDEGASLYELLQSRYHLYPARARETYTASAADRSSAELLGIAEGSPVFAVERVTLLPNQRPFEFVQSVVRGDRYSVVLDLVKSGAEKRRLVKT